jgi:hypothetical protein
MCEDSIEYWALSASYCDPGAIRTRDFLLRRQALYPLSYGVFKSQS